MARALDRVVRRVRGAGGTHGEFEVKESTSGGRN